VLATAGSSGIGLATAERLAERGVPVVANVRRAADAERLAALPGVEPVLCDVRSDDHVARLRAAIDERGDGLWRLVNKAGVAQAGHLTAESVHDMRDVFDINVFGGHRVTNAVVDLLPESGGRIVNMSSISGTLSSPEMGIYSMPKHALEAEAYCREALRLSVATYALPWIAQALLGVAAAPAPPPSAGGIGLGLGATVELGPTANDVPTVAWLACRVRPLVAAL